MFKLVYRASFTLPKAGTVINPSGFRIKVPFPVEIYQVSGKWGARHQSGKEIIRPDHQLPDTAKTAVAVMFDEQLTPWKTFEPIFGKEILDHQYRLEPDGKITETPPTHIATAGQHQTDPGTYWKTECGEHVTVKHLVSRHGGPPPTCPKCREILGSSAK